MKRMSEVFALPVSSGDRGYCADDVFQAGGNGEWCSTFCTDEQAKHAAHAINHVDALADALEALINLVNDKKDGDMFRSSAYKESVHALAAYRREK